MNRQYSRWITLDNTTDVNKDIAQWVDKCLEEFWNGSFTNRKELARLQTITAIPCGDKVSVFAMFEME